MFPFIYYIDCEGNLWVPCSCRCNGGNGNGAAEGSATLPQVRYTDSCEKRECIRPASESEKAMLHKEQALERLIIETREAVKRLEKLHERELVT
jgi:hypothetical protein